jgi:hypothetical protein
MRNNVLEDKVMRVVKDGASYECESDRLLISLDEESEDAIVVTGVVIKDYMYPSDVVKSIKHAVKLAEKLNKTNNTD